ncbi:MAG TPA: HAMP domain-containing sensor histidine kinase [Tepidiformaceae bacterium]|nr:HAMP domain-containing sensor histidine kinase [Tepidiformaceae bacterium]
MFERARLLLTASYAAALGLTLLGVGVVAYLLIQDDLNAEIDRSLRVAAASIDPGSFTLPTVEPGQRPDDSSDDDDEHDDDEDHPEAHLVNLPSDIFVIAFDRTGAVSANPRRVNLEGIDLAGLARRANGDLIDVSGDHGHYRMSLTVSGDGRFLAVGRSLRLVDHQLETLRLVFAFGGGAGLAISLASGFWLAGRTLGPIRRAMESQRQFVSDASHELRTPIAVARANNALLLDDPEASIESHLDQAEAVATELDHLSVLVGDLTTLARADEGRANLLLEDVNLGELADEVIRDMGALAEVLGVTLTCTAKPVRVRGDRARLRQLVVILVDNSLKYADQGGAVEVHCRSDGARAELSVTDNGPGITEEDQKRIFERFYRADAERTRAKGGTGLGLAIARWITEAHGGRISVDSQPGHGTTFRVRLPSIQSA